MGRSPSFREWDSPRLRPARRRRCVRPPTISLRPSGRFFRRLVIGNVLGTLRVEEKFRGIVSGFLSGNGPAQNALRSAGLLEEFHDEFVVAGFQFDLAFGEHRSVDAVFLTTSLSSMKTREPSSERVANSYLPSFSMRTILSSARGNCRPCAARKSRRPRFRTRCDVDADVRGFLPRRDFHEIGEVPHAAKYSPTRPGTCSASSATLRPPKSTTPPRKQQSKHVSRSF